MNAPSARASLQATPEARRQWEAYAVAKMQAEDSLLAKDGLAAAQAFYTFLETFMPQVFGSNVVPINLRRRDRDLA